MQRTVRDLANIEQLTAIPDLIQLLATRSATLLNFAKISRSSGLPTLFQPVGNAFFSVLITVLGAQLRQAFSKTPRRFLPDSGLLAHLVELSQERLSDFVGEAGLPGRLVETFVLSELLKHLAFSEKHLTLCHYRTQSNIEVDFVLENRLGKLTGIEVKASSKVDGKDFKGLRHLKETEPHAFQRCIVLCSGREVVPFDSDLFAVPSSMWWQSVRPALHHRNAFRRDHSPETTVQFPPALAPS